MPNRPEQDSPHPGDNTVAIDLTLPRLSCSETEVPSTPVYLATAQPLRTLLDYIQNEPNLHASHVAQAVTSALQSLLQAVDTLAVQGEETTEHLQRGSPAAADKRTQEASDRHKEWLQAADERSQRNKHLSAWKVAQDLAEDFGYSKHTIYPVILPLWRK